MRATPAHDSAKIIAWCSLIGLFLLGGVCLITGTTRFPMLHPDSFIWRMLGIGLAAVPFVAFGLAHLVSGRTAPGRLWVPLVLLSLFTMPLATTGTCYLLNAALDAGDVALHASPIARTHTYKQKNKRRYQVGIDAWWSAGETRWFRVDGPTYQAVEAGGDWALDLRVRPGWLGEPWIEDLQVVRRDG